MKSKEKSYEEHLDDYIKVKHDLDEIKEKLTLMGFDAEKKREALAQAKEFSEQSNDQFTRHLAEIKQKLSTMDPESHKAKKN